MKVFSGTLDQFRAAGRYRIIEDFDVIIVSGRATITTHGMRHKTLNFESWRDATLEAQKSIEGCAVVWDEKQN